MRGSMVRKAPNGSGGPPATLLPATARPVAVVLAGVCLAVTALLGAWITRQMSLDWLDSAVDAKARAALGGHPQLLDVLIWPGGPVAVTAMIIALALACATRRRYRELAFVVISVPTATMITELLLKPLIGPTLWGSPSFPSGHSTGVFALAAVVTVLLIARPGANIPRALRLLVALTAFLVAAVVAFALIARSMHDLAETVGGAATGVGTVLLTALTLDVFGSVRQHYHRRSRPTDLAPAQDNARPSIPRHS
jgi:membrane-associated phospholipid phosphatase